MDHLRSCTSGRGPKTARTAQKISSVSLTIDEIRFRMGGATVYEISRLAHKNPSGIDWPSAADENKPKIAVILKDNLSHNVVAHLK